MNNKVKVVLQTADHEALFFKEHEKRQIQALREKAALEADKKYREEHKGHCFRCGTKSLAEIRHGDVIIDICINEGCGAIHLDKGELEACQKSLQKSNRLLTSIKEAVSSVFK
ncbi:MAG: zf-TFIIB domain-containing protein [Deltaproteobacteria bacterium]|nr:zf-TFIIB domain-containing protein [Deltaproteobacteria bacterium]